MPRPALAWKTWSCVVAWSGAFVACATYEGATPMQDAGTDAGAAADAPAVNPDGPAAPPTPAGCDLDAPGGIPLACVVDSQGALFVRAGAVEGIGTKARPYGSFAEALAKRAGRSFFFVSAGDYAESVVVDASISIFGGFSPTFDDAPPRAGKTSILPLVGPALDVSLGGQRMRFEDLALQAGAPAPGTFSSLGAFVHHAGSFEEAVSFRRVSFDGGVGRQPPGEVTPAVGMACGASCSCAGIEGGEGGSGGVAPQVGAPPPPAGGGTAGTNGISSSPTACTSAGTAGGKGKDATTEGSPGVVSTQYAVDDAGLVGVRGAAGGTGPSGGGGGGGGGTTGGFPTTGGDGGGGGCGGAGGASGLPGGLAVALLVIDSIVTLDECSLRGGEGGRGADGATGAGGGMGNPGKAPGGFGIGCAKKGGDGGMGGKGGDGAGGIGGSTACLLTRSASLTVRPSLVCLPGLPGAGGAQAPAGQAFEKAELGADGNLSAID